MSDLVGKIDVEVVAFDPQYAGDFARLNYHWIEEYFVIEEHDREMLDDPQHYIIEKGGQIFFALHGERVIGTAALINVGERVFELAKMAVATEARGKGVGDKLIETCIEYSREVGKQTIFLLSNTKLKPAINLYRKFGFVQTVLDNTSPYERVDIKMQLDL